jgi:hypothetical protein
VGPRTSKLIKWGIDNGRELTRWNLGLEHLEDSSTIADYDKIRFQPQRTLFRLSHAIPVARDFDRLYRFSFCRTKRL